MRCFGRTKSFKRCKNEKGSFLFCYQHRYQLWVSVLAIFTFIATAGGFYQDIIDPLIGKKEYSIIEKLRIGVSKKYITEKIGEPIVDRIICNNLNENAYINEKYFLQLVYEKNKLLFYSVTSRKSDFTPLIPLLVNERLGTKTFDKYRKGTFKLFEAWHSARTYHFSEYYDNDCPTCGEVDLFLTYRDDAYLFSENEDYFLYEYKHDYGGYENQLALDTRLKQTEEKLIPNSFAVGKFDYITLGFQGSEFPEKQIELNPIFECMNIGLDWHTTRRINQD